MDLATILGLILGFGGLIGGVLLEGANAAMFINVSAAMIVLVGSTGVSTVSTSVETLLNLPRILKNAFFVKKEDLVELVELLIRFSDKARRDGVLSLEIEIDNIYDDFLKKGIQLVVDGTDAKLVHDVLYNEIDYMEERHQRGIAFFEAFGGFAPTLGIMGTVMGLVNILGNLSDPNEIGRLISAAFIATLYGVGSANLVALPIANKLKLRNKEEVSVKLIMLEGILSIQAGDNPKLLEEKLKTFIEPNLRKLITRAHP